MFVVDAGLIALSLSGLAVLVFTVFYCERRALDEDTKATLVMFVGMTMFAMIISYAWVTGLVMMTR